MISNEVPFNSLHFYQFTSGTYEDYSTLFTLATVEPLTLDSLNKIAALYIVTLHPELIVLRDEIRASWLFCQNPNDLPKEDTLPDIVLKYTSKYWNDLFDDKKVIAYLNSLDGMAVINSTEIYDGYF